MHPKKFETTQTKLNVTLASEISLPDTLEEAVTLYATPDFSAAAVERAVLLMFGAERVRKIQAGIRNLFLQNKTKEEVVEWVNSCKLNETVSMSAEATLNAEAVRISQITDPAERAKAGESFMRALQLSYGSKMGLVFDAE